MSCMKKESVWPRLAVVVLAATGVVPRGVAGEMGFSMESGASGTMAGAADTSSSRRRAEETHVIVRAKRSREIMPLRGREMVLWVAIGLENR